MTHSGLTAVLLDEATIRGPRANAPRLGKTVRKLIEAGPALRPLDRSRASNHIGDGAFILTSDNWIVLAKRSARVAHAAGQYDLTVSGSGILPPSGHYSVYEEMRGEIEGEMGIVPAEIRELYLLGVLRNLIRCGKPEMFFLAQCDIRIDEMRSRLGRSPRERFETADQRPLRGYDFSSKGMNRLLTGLVKVAS